MTIAFMDVLAAFDLGTDFPGKSDTIHTSVAAADLCAGQVAVTPPLRRLRWLRAVQGGEISVKRRGLPSTSEVGSKPNLAMS